MGKGRVYNMVIEIISVHEIKFMAILMCGLLETVLCAHSNFAECGMREPDNNLLLCHCDARCPLYHDCCYEYVNSSSFTPSDEGLDETLNISTCEQVHGQPYRIFLVSKLTAINHRLKGSVPICRNPNQIAPTEALPMYDFRTKTNFRNLYCHHIYRVIRGVGTDAVVALWTLQIDADCYYKIEANLSSRNYTDLLSRILSQKYCSVKMIPPENSVTRICFMHDIKGCSTGRACMSYQSPVANDAGEVFKNRDCILCGGAEQLSSADNQIQMFTGKQTVFTLNPIDVRYFTYYRIPCRNKKPCSRDEMSYCNTCMEPIASVKGFLHEAVYQIDSNKTFPGGADAGTAIRRLLTPVVNGIDHIHLSISVRTNQGRNASACKHFIQIAMYLREATVYNDYRRLQSNVTDSLKENRYEIEKGIEQLFLESNTECTFDFDDQGTENGKQIDVSKGIDQRVIVFVCVFGGLAFIMAGIFVVKAMVNRLATRGNARVTNTGGPRELSVSNISTGVDMVSHVRIEDSGAL